MSKPAAKGKFDFMEPTPGQTTCFKYLHKDHNLSPDPTRPEEFIDSSGLFRSDRYKSHEMDVIDGRKAPEKTAFGLHTTGFKLGQHAEAPPECPQVQAIDEVHTWVTEHALPRACKLVKEALDGEAVAVGIFDYTLRLQNQAHGALEAKNVKIGINAKSDVPVLEAHGDFTPNSGPARFKKVVEGFSQEGVTQGIVYEEGKMSIKGANEDEYRFVFVNCWQPLQTVEQFPLTVCDCRSTEPDDLVLRKFVFKHRDGETFAIKHNPNQKWYYFPRMSPAEGLLFKTYDSNKDASAKFTPHTGFIDIANEGVGHPPRQSVEIRCIAIIPKDSDEMAVKRQNISK